MAKKYPRSVELRRKAMKESSLPYCFNYKIIHAFYGQKCPICGVEMRKHEFAGRYFIPSIQHNIPISTGGKHELDNISVICRHCNVSIQDTPTKPLNTDLVRIEWEMICYYARLTKSKGGSRKWLKSNG
jgi:hypothetical protein